MMSRREIFEMLARMRNAADDEYFTWFDSLTRNDQAVVLAADITKAMDECFIDTEELRPKPGVYPMLGLADLILFVLRRRRWRGIDDLQHIEAVNA